MVAEYRAWATLKTTAVLRRALDLIFIRQLDGGGKCPSIFWYGMLRDVDRLRISGLARPKCGCLTRAGEHRMRGRNVMLGTVINLILQIFSGALGGNLAGAAKSIQLSTLLKTLSGAVGGVLGGQILGMFVPLLANTAASPDTAATIGQVAAGGVAGAVLTAILGTIKKSTA
jgi:hypothetical protein